MLYLRATADGSPTRPHEKCVTGLKAHLRMKTGKRPFTRLEMTALPVPSNTPLGSRSKGPITSLHTSKLRYACKHDMSLSCRTHGPHHIIVSHRFSQALGFPRSIIIIIIVPRLMPAIECDLQQVIEPCTVAKQSKSCLSSKNSTKCWLRLCHDWHTALRTSLREEHFLLTRQRRVSRRSVQVVTILQ